MGCSSSNGKVYHETMPVKNNHVDGLGQNNCVTLTAGQSQSSLGVDTVKSLETNKVEEDDAENAPPRRHSVGNVVNIVNIKSQMGDSGPIIIPNTVKSTQNIAKSQVKQRRNTLNCIPATPSSTSLATNSTTPTTPTTPAVVRFHRLDSFSGKPEARVAVSEYSFNWSSLTNGSWKFGGSGKIKPQTLSGNKRVYKTNRNSTKKSKK